MQKIGSNTKGQDELEEKNLTLKICINFLAKLFHACWHRSVQETSSKYAQSGKQIYNNFELEKKALKVSFELKTTFASRNKKTLLLTLIKGCLSKFAVGESF